MQRFTCTGRLTRDPELRELPNGGSVCKLRLAVDDMARGRETGYINVSTFGKPGEAAAEILSTGWLVAVDGRLEYHEWEQDGKTRHDYEVIGSVEFLAAPRATAKPPSPSGPSRQPPDRPRGRDATSPGVPPTSLPTVTHRHEQPRTPTRPPAPTACWSPTRSRTGWQAATGATTKARRNQSSKPARSSPCSSAPTSPITAARGARRSPAASGSSNCEPNDDRPRRRPRPLPADPRRRQPSRPADRDPLRYLAAACARPSRPPPDSSSPRGRSPGSPPAPTSTSACCSATAAPAAATPASAPTSRSSRSTGPTARSASPDTAARRR